MSNGPIHEAGETARSALSIFREQPFTLAMVLLNFAMLGFLYVYSVHSEEERKESLRLLYDNRKFVGDLLARCNLPTPPPIK